MDIMDMDAWLGLVPLEQAESRLLWPVGPRSLRTTKGRTTAHRSTGYEL